ncbi:MAG: Mur ligase domain-containing protein, partial [Candidatus Omnitrophica bacterium]|nr:Mur ligase domain-containing protein [Candidatus Omnitrophota bacterium]
MMYLKDILKGIKYKSDDDLSSVIVSGAASDSRLVKKNSLFVALKGHDQDGHNFINEAIRKGAKVIVSQRNFRSGPGVRKIFADTEKELPRIAANFYKNPASRLKMIGVTGTNGKTTITYLMESI